MSGGFIFQLAREVRQNSESQDLGTPPSPFPSLAAFTCPYVQEGLLAVPAVLPGCVDRAGEPCLCTLLEVHLRRRNEHIRFKQNWKINKTPCFFYIMPYRGRSEKPSLIAFCLILQLLGNIFVWCTK